MFPLISLSLQHTARSAHVHVPEQSMLQKQHQTLLAKSVLKLPIAANNNKASEVRQQENVSWS